MWVRHGRATRQSNAVSTRVDRVDVYVRSAAATLGHNSQSQLHRLHLLKLELFLLATALVVDAAHRKSDEEYENSAHADTND